MLPKYQPVIKMETAELGDHGTHPKLTGWTVTEGPSILVVNLNALSRVPQWSADIHWPQDIIRINHESETE